MKEGSKIEFAKVIILHPKDDDKKKAIVDCWIARCLNIGTRIALLNQDEVDKVFLKEKKNKKVILAFTNHDFRSMKNDFDTVYEMLKDHQKNIILTKFANAKKAFHLLTGKPKSKIRFKVNKKTKFILSLIKKYSTTTIFSN